MHFDTLIANGTVVTEHDTLKADVGIANGKVTAIEHSLPTSSAQTLLDVSGKYVLPGGVDVHTHLDMPLGSISSSDDFETGTRAAAFGGTTTIIDFATQSKGQSLKAAVDIWMQKAASHAVIDYGFHCIITDLGATCLEEMDGLVREGITSFKVFMAYPGTLMLDDGDIFKVLRASSQNGALVCVHAENGSVIDVLVRQALAGGNTAPKYHALTRPTSTEAEAVGRAIALAQMANAPLYIVHVSCGDALEKISQARSQGLPVYSETCPQYLYVSIEDMDKPGFEGAKCVFTPPPREKWNHEKLWNGIKNRDLDVISTDHCPFFFRGQKDLGVHDFTKIPNGGPGIEHRMSLIYSGGVATGRFSINRFVEVTATMPAKLFGLYPRKGTIKVGSDADIVVFNPNGKQTISAKNHHMRVDYSLFEGLTLTGVPDVVLSRGRVLIQDNKFHAVPGSGTFLKRAPFHFAPRDLAAAQGAPQTMG
jgi:dihydropyrimidinase